MKKKTAEELEKMSSYELSREAQFFRIYGRESDEEYIDEVVTMQARAWLKEFEENRRSPRICFMEGLE